MIFQILSGKIFPTMVLLAFQVPYPSAKNFIQKLLQVDPALRYNITQAMQHTWLVSATDKWEREIYAKISNPDESLKNTISKILSNCTTALRISLMKNLMNIVPPSQWSSLVPIVELDEVDLSNYISGFGLASSSIQVVRKKILFVGNFH